MGKLTSLDEKHLRRALDLARKYSCAGTNGPFGAVVVRDDTIIGEGWNQVVAGNDPTAHAEIVAIRQACRTIGCHDLSGARLFASCEPCPMCLAAAYWARIEVVICAAGRQEAALAGFDDDYFYQELCRPPEERQIPLITALPEEGRAVFEEWLRNPHRVIY